MLTQNNFFTMIKKWGMAIKDLGNPPMFYKQSFDTENKQFVPFDELKSRIKNTHKKDIISHFFIQDNKQVCFISNPAVHKDILNSVYATCSPDFSVFLNVYPQFNNATILLNRLIASSFQQQDRFVILTLSWGNADTYNVAFDNIQRGSIVAVSTLGINDQQCFRLGFTEMIKRVSPQKICWYYKIPDWVKNVYLLENIVIMQKRYENIESTKSDTQYLF